LGTAKKNVTGRPRRQLVQSTSMRKTNKKRERGREKMRGCPEQVPARYTGMGFRGAQQKGCTQTAETVFNFRGGREDRTGGSRIMSRLQKEVQRGIGGRVSEERKEVRFA